MSREYCYEVVKWKGHYGLTYVSTIVLINSNCFVVRDASFASFNVLYLVLYNALLAPSKAEAALMIHVDTDVHEIEVVRGQSSTYHSSHGSSFEKFPASVVIHVYMQERFALILAAA